MSKTFDRLWPYPEAVARVLPLLPDDATKEEFRSLVTDGYPKNIAIWLDNSQLGAEAKEFVRAAMPPDAYQGYPALFDEICVGRAEYRDGPGTMDWVLSRRVEGVFHHRVYQDGAGNTVQEWTTARPLTRKQFDAMIRARPWLHWDSYDGGGCPFRVVSCWDPDGTWFSFEGVPHK